MMTERIFAHVDRWALGADASQWILYRREGKQWHGTSFVRSSRDILARCMREKGVSASDAALLLDGLPETFDEWLAASRGFN
jgi:hypothetical protein